MPIAFGMRFQSVSIRVSKSTQMRPNQRTAFNLEDHDLSELCGIPQNMRCMVTCSTIVYEAGLEGVTISSSECKDQCEAKEQELCTDDAGDNTDLASLFQNLGADSGSSARGEEEEEGTSF